MGFIIITGGMGLLGQSVLRSVLSSRSCISKQYTRVILVDTDNVFPPEVGDARGVDTSQHGSQSTSVSTLRRDVGSPEFAAELRQLIMENGAYFPLTIFHLASVMSAQGEEDFERALHVNVDGEFHKIQMYKFSSKENIVHEAKLFLTLTVFHIHLRLIMVGEHACFICTMRGVLFRGGTLCVGQIWVEEDLYVTCAIICCTNFNG